MNSSSATALTEADDTDYSQLERYLRLAMACRFSHSLRPRQNADHQDTAKQPARVKSNQCLNDNVQNDPASLWMQVHWPGTDTGE